MVIKLKIIIINNILNLPGSMSKFFCFHKNYLKTLQTKIYIISKKIQKTLSEKIPKTVIDNIACFI